MGEKEESKLADINDHWPEVYHPKWDILAKTDKETPFGEASFELLKEITTYMHLASGLIPTHSLERDNAIIHAMALKTSKLGIALIAMTAHLGGDRQLVLTRELLEAVAILNYLLKDDDGSRFEKYVQDSLVSERMFIESINKNIAARGNPLPIEESMKHSAIRTALAAGVDDLEALPRRDRVGWPKAEALILELNENAYLSYRGSSSVIHSKWDDLFSNHLKQLPDGAFELQFDHSPCRPQPLYGAGLMMLAAIEEYLSKMHPEAVDVFRSKIDDAHERLLRVFELHGNYLDKKRD